MNKSCCWDFTAYMNTFVTRLLIVLFLIVAIMTGVLDWIQKRIKRKSTKKFGEASFAVDCRARTHSLPATFLTIDEMK